MFISTEEQTCLSKHKRNPKRSLTLENLVLLLIELCSKLQRMSTQIAHTTAQTGFGYVNLVQTNLQIIINETYTPSVLNCNNYDFG